MEAQAIIKPEIQQSTMQEVMEAQALIVSTKEDYEISQIYMGRIKQRIKMLEEERMAQTRPLDESKKRIIDFFRPHLQKLNDAKEHLNMVMVRWTEEAERKRREEERRLQEEAHKRAEEEALAQAIEAEKIGDIKEAEAILEQPVEVPAIKVMSEIPKSKESHIRETWSAEGFDLMMTIKAIAEGKAPIQAVEYDKVFLNKQATSYKSALNIPGVKPISKKTQI